jgi:hypothetical protein
MQQEDASGDQLAVDAQVELMSSRYKSAAKVRQDSRELC